MNRFGYTSGDSKRKLLVRLLVIRACAHWLAARLPLSFCNLITSTTSPKFCPGFRVPHVNRTPPRSTTARPGPVGIRVRSLRFSTAGSRAKFYPAPLGRQSHPGALAPRPDAGAGAPSLEWRPSGARVFGALQPGVENPRLRFGAPPGRRLECFSCWTLGQCVDHSSARALKSMCRQTRTGLRRR